MHADHRGDPTASAGYSSGRDSPGQWTGGVRAVEQGDSEQIESRMSPDRRWAAAPVRSSTPSRPYASPSGSCGLLSPADTDGSIFGAALTTHERSHYSGDQVRPPPSLVG
jgi:hypothetical protein